MLKRFDSAYLKTVYAVFQPKIQTDTGKIVAAEMLARSSLFANYLDMIAHMEQDGSIRALDWQIFEFACVCSSELAKFKKTVPLTINFSRCTLMGKHVSKNLSSIANRYGVAHNLVEIEVTESYVCEKIDSVCETLSEIKAAGFRVAIDDFGKGCSNLEFLRRVEFDTIKIAAVFLKDFNIEKNKIIFDWLIELTKRLGKSVVVEGVESNLQAEYIKHCGCEFAQGFFYGKPVRFEEFKMLLNKDELPQKTLRCM